MEQESKWEVIDSYHYRAMERKKDHYEKISQMKYKHGYLVKHEIRPVDGRTLCAMVFVPDLSPTLVNDLEFTAQFYKDEVDRLKDRLRRLEASRSVEG